MGYLNADKTQELFANYGKSNTDTGSPESQVALFSYRINHLTAHLKKNKKDFGTQRSLLRLVGKRRQLLEYLKKVDIERYSKGFGAPEIAGCSHAEWSCPPGQLYSLFKTVFPPMARPRRRCAQSTK